MLFQKSHHLKLLIATMITSSVFSQNIPQPIQNLYQSKVDSSISDEFNNNRTDNSVDLTKWNYRRTKNSGPSTKYVKEQFGYVSCKGIKADKRAGGIVTKKFKKYGFYTVKWRALGIASNKRSAWHPSIWSAVGNGQLEGTKAKKQVPNIGKGWLEIDMIEFENFSTTNTYWSSDAPARVPSPNPNGKLIKVNDAEGIKLGYKKAVMIPKVTSGFASWQTHGLEYTPTYLQMWKITNKGWSKQGKKLFLIIITQVLDPYHWILAVPCFGILETYS